MDSVGVTQADSSQAIPEDNTERDRTEAALRESEARYQTLFDAIDEGFCVVEVLLDDEGRPVDYRFLEINRTFAEETGLDGAVGKTALELVPDLEPFWIETYGAVGLTGEPVRFESRAEAMGRTFEVYAFRIGVPERRQVAIRFKNITERRRAEEERERLLQSEQAARAEAEAANRAKDEFLSVLSHELRTPLTPIFGYVQMLRRGTPAPDRLRLGLEMIERNARIQARIVEDLLDVSRILSGKLSVEMTPLEPASIVRAAMDAIRPAAEAKGVIIDVAIEAGGWVTGDQVRLRQVMDNLLSNAVKFTPAGGRIDVSLAERDGEIVLTIADSGAGIPAHALPRVFDRFHQADSSSTRAQGGLGLGLAIVRHLVERHGGRVSAESAGDGLGARFTVWLPLAAPPDDGLAVDEAARDARSAGRLAGLRILVVDDDEDTRAFLRTLIAEEGGRVVTVASSGEALAALAGARFDLVLADIGMPNEDGYAMLARLRAQGAATGGRTPAIALTAYASADDRRRALDAGFQQHLPKPVDLDALVSEILATVGDGRTR